MWLSRTLTRAASSVLLVLLLAVIARPADYFAAPGGSSNGDGSFDNPWSLAKALSFPAKVDPGDTIWLRGGKYPISGTLSSSLRGTAAAPIVVRQYPGERATLDTGTNSDNRLIVGGAYTWYWGFELMSSSPYRFQPNGGSLARGLAIDTGNNAGDPNPGIKFINLVVHDAALGFGIWRYARECEMYGCLIYYNGFDAADRGHGHAIYTQNDSVSTKRFSDNIMFGQYSHGFHAYGSSNAFLDRLDVEGNISFENGVISTISEAERNLLIGGGNIAHDPVVRANYSYYRPGVPGIGIELKYDQNTQNAIVEDNVSATMDNALTLADRGTPVVTGNRVYGLTSGFNPNNYPDNDWYGTNRPSGTWAFVRPNSYDPGRAHIVVYNWDNLDTVNVDLGGFLRSGERYQVFDAQNYYGPAVVASTHAAGTTTIALPMNLTAAAAIIGWPARKFEHTPKEFNVFVLIKEANRSIQRR